MQHSQSKNNDADQDHIEANNRPKQQPEFSNYVINYQKRVEDIINWLFAKEEQLQHRLDEISLQDAPINEILQEYSNHEKFIEEFCIYSNVITKCKEDGLELIDGGIVYLTDEDRDEIGIQIDTMVVCNEKLKILSTDRLNLLRKIIEERQQSKFECFEQWLSTIEAKIPVSINIGPDMPAIEKQLVDVNSLRVDLERKQEFLDFMSNVVIFDEYDRDSLQIRSRSCESLDARLESVNTRWQRVCSFVNDRILRLQKAKFLWEILNNEGPKLLNWIKKIERTLAQISHLAKNLPETHSDLTHLIGRSDEIEVEIKNKGQFYASVEQQVKSEMSAFDETSMLAIELEKTLEELRYSWESMSHNWRMLDSKLHAKTTAYKMVPIPGHITSGSNHTLDMNNLPSNNGNLNEDENITFNSYSSDNDEKDFSINIGSSLSESKPPSSSMNSAIKSIFQETQKRTDLCCNDSRSQDDLSQTNSMTGSFPLHLSDPLGDPNFVPGLPNELSIYRNTHPPEIQHDGAHHCRVEEWKHSLESFSTWLKGVEASLASENSLDSLLCRDSSLSQLDLSDQLLLLVDFEAQINPSCQAEFDCLILQGQQIISDLIPEIGGNDYEHNLKEILADIEFRYSAVKRSLYERKQEFADRDRWLNLSTRLRDSSNQLIEQMGKVIPENNIGVDLITLAQQQDELIRAKSELEDNASVQSTVQEAKLFLKMCDTLQQQFGPAHQSEYLHSRNELHFQNNSIGGGLSFRDIWLLLSDLRSEIESQLDRVSIHQSELSQLIDDRLERLDEVHKEMHALQQSMQEFATKLQVAEIVKSNWVPLDDLSLEQLSEQLEDLKLFRERMTEMAATYDELNSIFDWMEQSDVPTNQQNLKRLSELNTIWGLIHASADERQKQIELAFEDQSASEQKFLAQTVADLPGWERKVATSKVPYFLDHNSNKTNWDHPKFSDMLNSMNSVQQVVYSAYRTALKLRMVQKKFGIDLLMLEQLKDIFSSFNFNNQQRANDSNCPATKLSSSNNVIPFHQANDSLAGVEQIIHLLGSIYERIKIEEKPSLDVPLAIDLTLNWLLNLYDSTRTGYVSVLSLKIGLALICCATREEKYTYMFELMSNQDGCVDGRRLGTLFETCIRIPIYLGEGASFGGTDIIEKSIRNCFTMSKFNPDRPNTIELSDYLSWLRTEPQFIIWLPVLHRVLVSENTHHKVRCKLCGAKPIMGLRYRCLKCLKFNICQNCFLIGRHIAEHPDQSKHPIHEYCYESTSGANVKDLSKILRNKLKPKAGLVGSNLANQHRVDINQ